MTKYKFTMLEFFFLLIIAVTLGALVIAFGLRTARESARKISCLGNLKQIGLGLRFYSSANEILREDGVTWDAYFPQKRGRAGLQELVTTGFLCNGKVYTCPSTNDWVKSLNQVSTNASYAYAGGLTEATSVDSAVASDRAGNHNKYGNILFVDGHVRGFSGINWTVNWKSDLGDFW